MSRMMELRVRLEGAKPAVWRRLLVDPRLTLEQLHMVLQWAFRWTSSHLHQFHDEDGTRYSTPAPAGFDDLDRDIVDERKVCLAEVFDRLKKELVYEYDFGDSWMHGVRLESWVESESVEYPSETFLPAGRGVFSGKPRAAMCLEGERSGPPEDCGGIYGYQRLLELRRKPPHPTAKRDEGDRELLEWLGEWDPDCVDLAEINQALDRVRVKKAFQSR